jgi:hypothetical protein
MFEASLYNLRNEKFGNVGLRIVRTSDLVRCSMRCVRSFLRVFNNILRIVGGVILDEQRNKCISGLGRCSCYVVDDILFDPQKI